MAEGASGGQDSHLDAEGGADDGKAVGLWQAFEDDQDRVLLLVGVAQLAGCFAGPWKGVDGEGSGTHGLSLLGFGLE